MKALGARLARAVNRSPSSSTCPSTMFDEAPRSLPMSRPMSTLCSLSSSMFDVGKSPPTTPTKRTGVNIDADEQVIDATKPINVRETPNQPGGQDLIQNVMVRYNQNTMANTIWVAFIPIILYSTFVKSKS